MKKIFFLTAGIVCLILGIIGLMLPVIPQVPFLVAAALLLMRGSETIHRRILRSRLYTGYIFPNLKDRPFLLRLMDAEELCPEETDRQDDLL